MPVPASGHVRAGCVVTPAEALLVSASLPRPAAAPTMGEDRDAVLPLAAVEPVTQALATAVLALQAAGTVTVRVAARRRWLVLGPRSAVELRGSDTATVIWPDGSPEARLAVRLAVRDATSPIAMRALADLVLERDRAPAERFVAASLASLARRGVLVETIVETSQGRIVPSLSRYYQPSRAGAAACEAAEREARALVTACLATDPTLWPLLLADARVAIRRATQRRASGDGGG